MKIPANIHTWSLDDFAQYCKDHCNSQFTFVWDEKTETLKCIQNYLDYIPEYNWTIYFYEIWAGLRALILQRNGQYQGKN